MSKKYIFGRMTLVIDHDDPDTPAIVEIGRETSTFDKVQSVGAVGDSDEHEVTQKESAWLDSKQHLVDAAYEAARGGLPEYQ